MTIVDIRDLHRSKNYADVCEWCVVQFGPIHAGRWTLKDLRYLIFDNDKDATFTILKWA
jgi:hypothetical protein